MIFTKKLYNPDTFRGFVLSIFMLNVMTTDFVIPFAMKEKKEKKEQTTRRIHCDRTKIQKRIEKGAGEATALIMSDECSQNGVPAANMEAGGV